MPVKGSENLYVVPGSIQETCHDCGQKVWVAPTSQKMMLDHSMTVVCYRCGFIRWQIQPGKIESIEEQEQEIKVWRRRN